jgi:hypothetical protein
MNKPDLLEQWHKRKGQEPWSGEEIAELIVEASYIGEAIGERMERERIIEILKNIPPGSGLMGDDIGLAIELLRGEN